MKQPTESKKLSVWDILKLFTPLIPLALLLSYYYFKNESENKLFWKQGIDTECIVIAYGEERTGVRGPRKGYYNKCRYFINDSIHYCYIFTTVKPLPVNEKIKLKYFQANDGRIRIDFPNTEKEKYKEYGFNDYGY